MPSRVPDATLLSALAGSRANADTASADLFSQLRRLGLLALLFSDVDSFDFSWLMASSLQFVFWSAYMCCRQHSSFRWEGGVFFGV